MKVFAVRMRYSKDLSFCKKGDIESVKWVTCSPICCVVAHQAWCAGFIGFGEKDATLNKLERVCIYVCSPYPEGAVWEAMPIDFCPFCATPIVLSVTG